LWFFSLIYQACLKFLGKTIFEGGLLHIGVIVQDSYNVIRLLEDPLKEWGFLQVMTQVIGQESYQAALHPLPTGSRIMGGQGKRIVSPG
jgi:hypothetical protein